MNEDPSVPDLSAAPDVLQGHLWLQELVAGGRLRFQVDDRGLVFGGPDRVFDRWDEPLRYAAAVRHVRERFDAARFRDLVDDPTDYVFYGVSTHACGVPYDWERLPPFLGTDVWSDDDGFLPPDRVERAFDRLGLSPVNALAKEVPARDFDPETYEVPASEWYDGPAAGVVVRNKRGGRAKIESNAGDRTAPDADDSDENAPATDATDAEVLAERFVTDDRIDAVAAALADEDREATVDAVLERIVATVAREERPELLADDAFDERAFRTAVAERVQRRLDRSG